MSYGGGFMTGSQGSGDSPSGGGKKAGTSALRPVTIHQVISAQQAFGDAEFLIDGTEVKDVTLVACIRSVNITTTQATFLVEDGTGQIDCRMWIENSGGEDGESDPRLASLENNKYVRILGSLKTFAEKRHVSAQRVRPVTNMNEINFHLIECAYVHKCITNGPPGGANTAMVTDRPYDGAGGNPYAAEDTGGSDEAIKDLPLAQKQIWRFIRDQVASDPSGTSDGVNIMAIVRNLGQGVEKVKELTAAMCEDGILYTGLDDDHLMCT
ncbi:hypothetical protein JCM11491_004890 [Sporobolomyces phaffii]